MSKTHRARSNAELEHSLLMQAINRTMNRAEREGETSALRSELKQLVGFYGQKPGLWAIERMEKHVQEHGTGTFTAEEFTEAKAEIIKRTRTNFTMNFGQEHKSNPEKRMELLRKLKRGLRMELSELLNPAESKNDLARRIISDLESHKATIDSGDQARFADEAIQALRETRRETLAVLMQYVDSEIGKTVRGMGQARD